MTFLNGILFRAIQILIGNGHPGRNYGPAKNASITQSSGIHVDSKNIYICDTAESSVLLSAPTSSIVKFFQNSNDFYAAYHIHAGKDDTHPNLDQAITLMKSVCAFDKKCKTDIKEEFKLNINLQGPQGCVSSVYSSNVSKHVSILEALRDDYPDQKAEIRTSAIGTKPNESTFSLIRGRQLTPDAFEFGRIFPKLVREHVLKCSADPEFLYVTNQKKSHYEQSTGFYRLEVPSIPKIHKADPLSHENLLILRDYKANYLQGVRQNTIRNQNTKSKAGTFPLYAYLTQPPEASP